MVFTYFNEKYKKAIPKIPNRVGVVTAPTGAAIKDILSTIKRRYPICEIILFPSLVQGEFAAEDIVKNIKLAENYEHKIIDANNGVNKVSSDIKKAVAPYLGICPDCIR